MFIKNSRNEMASAISCIKCKLVKYSFSIKNANQNINYISDLNFWWNCIENVYEFSIKVLVRKFINYKYSISIMIKIYLENGSVRFYDCKWAND